MCGERDKFILLCPVTIHNVSHLLHRAVVRTFQEERRAVHGIAYVTAWVYLVRTHVCKRRRHQHSRAGGLVNGTIARTYTEVLSHVHNYMEQIDESNKNALCRICRGPSQSTTAKRLLKYFPALTTLFCSPAQKTMSSSYNLRI